MTRLSEALFAVWDVETTGLSPVDDAVVEVGLALLQGGEVVFSGALLVDPGRPIPEDVTLIHGIRDVDVAGAPSLLEALESLGQVMPRPPTAYVAHAAAFDRGFLGLTQAPWICTLRLAQHLLPYHPRRLGALCHELGIPMGREHRADDDARAAALLLARLLPLLPPEVETVAQLAAFTDRPLLQHLCRVNGFAGRPWTELTLAELQAIATHEDLDPDARHSLAHYRGEVEG